VKTIGSICALFIGLLAVVLQGPAAGGTGGNEFTGGANNCDYEGYVESDCNSPCTDGQKELALQRSDDHGSHDWLAGGTTRGDCSGGVGCSTPETTKLTTSGCSGG
jgi:hypothetical protein